AETLDDLALRLEGDLIESGHCNKDLYQVAKMECKRNLQDWQAKLSQAAAATQRADRARSELTRMREAYLREVAGLRQQLVRKEQAEERGAEFVPDIISHFSVHESLSQEVEDRLEEQRKRLEEQHQSELEKLMKDNLELLHKFKNKAMQASLQGNLLAQKKEAPEQIHAATQTPTEKRENKATETVSVQHASIEVQTSDDTHGASIAANMPSEEADIEVDELDCLDLDVLVTTMEIPEDRRANSRRRNSKARARSGSVATNDSEVMGKRTSQGRSRTASREFSGGKPRPRKRSPDRDTSVSDLESNAGSSGPDAWLVRVLLNGDRKEKGYESASFEEDGQHCEHLRVCDTDSSGGVDERALLEPEARRRDCINKRDHTSQRYEREAKGVSRSQASHLERLRAWSGNSGQGFLPLCRLLPSLSLFDPFAYPENPSSFGSFGEFVWTQGFDTPASAFPAFAEEASKRLWQAMDSEGDPETEDQVAGAEVTFEKDRSHGALTGPAHYKRFSVSSQGHSAAMVSRTEGARPSQRTISRTAAGCDCWFSNMSFL
ncbi:unnamed protein product, partial [Symbiodinium sp. CCMP2456]